MSFSRWAVLIAVAIVASGCGGTNRFSGPPRPSPRDMPSPDGISPDLAQVAILWSASSDSEDGILYTVLGPTSEPLRPPPVDAVMIEIAPSRRYYAFGTDLFPGGTIEVLDLVTGERSLLVEGETRFPGAALRFPSFSWDDRLVVFEVSAGNRIDVGLFDLRAGTVQLLDLGGGFNKWPRVSPDGSKVLVVCEKEAQAAFSLCLLDREKRTRGYLVDDSVFTNGMFAPDGNTIVYIAVEGSFPGEGRLYRVGVDGIDQRLLASDLHSGAAVLAVTADSAVFTCRYPDEPACSWVCTVGLDGANPQRLIYLGKQCVASAGGSGEAQP